jgi:hypothetical protein
VRGLSSGEVVGIQSMNLLKQCLGQLGATPADASKITIPEEDDQDDEFFGDLSRA